MSADVSKSGKRSDAFKLQYGRGPKVVRHICLICKAGWDHKKDMKKCCKDIDKY